MVKPEEGRGSGRRETKSWVDGIKCHLQIGVDFIRTSRLNLLKKQELIKNMASLKQKERFYQVISHILTKFLKERVALFR